MVLSLRKKYDARGRNSLTAWRTAFNTLQCEAAVIQFHRHTSP